MPFHYCACNAITQHAVFLSKPVQNHKYITEFPNSILNLIARNSCILISLAWHEVNCVRPTDWPINAKCTDLLKHSAELPCALVSFCYMQQKHFTVSPNFPVAIKMSFSLFIKYFAICTKQKHKYFSWCAMMALTVYSYSMGPLAIKYILLTSSKLL